MLNDFAPWVVILMFAAIFGLSFVPFRGWKWAAMRIIGVTDEAPLFPPSSHKKPGENESNDEVALLRLCKKELDDISEDLLLTCSRDNAQRSYLLNSIRRAEDTIDVIAGHRKRNEFTRCHAKYGDICHESVKLPQLRECASSCADFVSKLSRWLQRKRLAESIKNRASEKGLDTVFPLEINNPKQSSFRIRTKSANALEASIYSAKVTEFPHGFRQVVIKMRKSGKKS